MSTDRLYALGVADAVEQLDLALTALTMPGELASDARARLVCHDYGDAALLVNIIGDDYTTRWSTAQSLGEALRSDWPPGLIDVVASYQDLFVSFDPLVTGHAALRGVVAELAGRPRRPRPRPRPRQHFVVPVVYGGEFGPDLAAVADALSTTEESVVALHLAGDWTVRFVGTVGAPMMDGPRLPASVPRLVTPRARVQPGSVAVSGLHCMVYNAASPGGWRLIGRTPARLFDLDRPPHVPYRSGDTIRFERIDPADWSRWDKPLEACEPVRDGAA